MVNLIKPTSFLLLSATALAASLPSLDTTTLCNTETNDCSVRPVQDASSVAIFEELYRIGKLQVIIAHNSRRALDNWFDDLWYERLESTLVDLGVADSSEIVRKAKLKLNHPGVMIRTKEGKSIVDEKLESFMESSTTSERLDANGRMELVKKVKDRMDFYAAKSDLIREFFKNKKGSDNLLSTLINKYTDTMSPKKATKQARWIEKVVIAHFSDMSSALRHLLLHRDSAAPDRINFLSCATILNDVETVKKLLRRSTREEFINAFEVAAEYIESQPSRTIDHTGFDLLLNSDHATEEVRLAAFEKLRPTGRFSSILSLVSTRLLNYMYPHTLETPWWVHGANQDERSER